MKRVQVSDNCYAALNDKNLLCDANSGFINRGGGVVIDTQSDLGHARQMIDLFKKVAPTSELPQRVINTHEDADHVWGNQLFTDSEIIGHSSLPDRMQIVADPKGYQELLASANDPATSLKLESSHPGLLRMAQQVKGDYNFDDIELVVPTTLFDERHELDLDGITANLIYVGPCHEIGDTIIHVPEEGVVFAGDIIFRLCTPMGWSGSLHKWIQALDLITELNPTAIVPGHGPICDLEGVRDMKAYLEYVCAEAKTFFDQGLSALEAAKRIEFGPYSEWNAPSRLYFMVECAYREFRGDAVDAEWDNPLTYDSIYELAKAKGIEVEY